MSKERYLEYKEIKDILEEQMTQFEAINNEIIDNQNDFRNINENYEKYNNSIDEGRDHITKLKKREFYENLFVWIGFCIFMLCVTYILLRRFPIHKIFIYIYKLGKKIVNFFIRLFILSSSDKKNLNKNEL